MWSWLTKEPERQEDSKVFANIVDGLTDLYQSKLLPVERDNLCNQFYSHELTDADFSTRPMVLLLGQYSTGKTTFVQHLLGREYPGSRIGEEPTTDSFVVVSHGDADSLVPGDALVADPLMPFNQCFFFGKKFLSRFQGSRCDCPVLEGITFIDTPGVLTGEKQRLDRGYDFESVMKWFAARVDIILLFFDVFKLDISGELGRAVGALHGHDHKIHILLNKADQVTTAELLRAHGALMWALRGVVSRPEVPRVYIGSFWDEPISNNEQRDLFESEENELYILLARLPRGASVRKLNDLMRRTRLTKVHVFILDSLARKMPTLFGKDKQKQSMIQNIVGIYQEICKEKDVTMGDFPDPRMMQEKLQQYDFSKFKKFDQMTINVLDDLIKHDLPALIKLVPNDEKDAEVKHVSAEESPFAAGKGVDEASVHEVQSSLPSDMLESVPEAAPLPLDTEENVPEAAPLPPDVAKDECASESFAPESRLSAPPDTEEDVPEAAPLPPDSAKVECADESFAPESRSAPPGVEEDVPEAAPLPPAASRVECANDPPANESQLSVPPDIEEDVSETAPLPPDVAKGEGANESSALESQLSAEYFLEVAPEEDVLQAAPLNALETPDGETGRTDEGLNPFGEEAPDIQAQCPSDATNPFGVGDPTEESNPFEERNPFDDDASVASKPVLAE